MMEKSHTLGRGERGCALGALVVLLHGTHSTRQDFAQMEERNAQVEAENECMREELEKTPEDDLAKTFMDAVRNEVKKLTASFDEQSDGFDFGAKERKFRRVALTSFRTLLEGCINRSPLRSQPALAHGMDYPTYCRNGWCCSSAVIESTSH